jgi:hypothetical protein
MNSKEFLKQKKLKRAKDYLVKVSRWTSISLLPKQINGTVSVSEITSLVSVGVFYFVILVFAFPVALPLPYPPGFPSICGLPIFLLSFQMMLAKKTIMLPKFVKEYRIKLDLIRLIISKSLGVFKFISKIIKPNRFAILTINPLAPFYGFLFFIFSICILIPLPGTNFIPAVGIFLACLGLLFKDGFLALVGSVVGILGVLMVYFLGAYFAILSAKLIKITYLKIASITLLEVIFVALFFLFCIALWKMRKKLFKK